MTPPTDREREAFEEWAQDEGYYVFNDPINEKFPVYYTEENVRCMWSAWRAALSTRDGEVAKAVAGERARCLAIVEAFIHAVPDSSTDDLDRIARYSNGTVVRIASQIRGGA